MKAALFFIGLLCCIITALLPQVDCLKETKKTKLPVNEEALLNAASQGNLYQVKQALLNGAYVDCRDGTAGSTPLMWASFNNRSDVVVHLLKNAASIDALSLDGHKTPLLMAAYQGHASIIELLLSKGASVNKKNQRGDTALQLAAYMGHLEAVKTLLERRPDLNARTVKQLYTALHFATFKGHLEIVEVLLTAGASVTVKDHEGKTPFLGAAAFGNSDILKFLLQRGLVNSADEITSASAPLSRKMAVKKEKQSQHKVVGGGKKSSSSSSTISSSKMATKNGQKQKPQVVTVDISREGQMKQLEKSRAAEMGIILEEEGDDEGDDDEEEEVGSTPKKHDDNNSEYSEEDDDDYDDDDDEDDDDEDDDDDVDDEEEDYDDERFVDEPFDINIRDRNGNTALMLAAHSGCAKCVEVLLFSAGVVISTAEDEIKDDNSSPLNLLRVEARNMQQQTALHIAASRGYVDVVRLLILSGANFGVQDATGTSAIMAARQGMHEGVVSLLEELVL